MMSDVAGGLAVSRQRQPKRLIQQLLPVRPKRVISLVDHYEGPLAVSVYLPDERIHSRSGGSDEAPRW